MNTKIPENRKRYFSWILENIHTLIEKSSLTIQEFDELFKFCFKDTKEVYDDKPVVSESFDHAKETLVLTVLSIIMRENKMDDVKISNLGDPNKEIEMISINEIREILLKKHRK